MDELRSGSVGVRRVGPAGLAAVAALAVLYAALAGASTVGMNPDYDEVTDLHIAYSLLRDPLTGSGLDGSQARLPMYLSAAAIGATEILYPRGRFEAHVMGARLLSIAAAVGAILLTFLLARRWFGTRAALLAAGLLAVSPYFLEHGRTAMTNGDALTPLAVLVALWAFDRFDARRTSTAAVALGLALGVALALKFLLLLLIPALIGYQVMRGVVCPGGVRGGPRRVLRGPVPWALLGLSAAAGAATLAGVAVGVATRREAHPLALAFWVGALLCLGAAGWTVWAWPRQRRDHPPPAQDEPALAPWAAWLVVVAVAGTAALALVPAHVLQPVLWDTLLHRAGTWDGEAPDAAAGLRLYGGIVLLKLGLPLGVLTVAAFAWAVAAARRDRHLLLLWVLCATWAATLLSLPLYRAAYPMPVYPLVVLVLSAGVVAVADRLRARPAAAWAWRGAVAAGVAFLLVGTARSYPEFGYFAYETIGDTWLGAPTRGTRNVVRVTLDGSLDALRWAAARVPPGGEVTTLSWDRRTIGLVREELPCNVRMVGSTPAAEYIDELDTADALIVTLQNRTRHRNAPPDDVLRRHFGPPAHVIYRGRGVYRMPVAEVYLKRDASDSGGSPAPEPPAHRMSVVPG